MKESYDKGLATHIDPKSCAMECREGVGEALTGARAGRTMSRESFELQGADAVGTCGRRNRVRRYRKVQPSPCAVKEPVHVRKLLAREPGSLAFARSRITGREGKSKD